MENKKTVHRKGKAVMFYLDEVTDAKLRSVSESTAQSLSSVLRILLDKSLIRLPAHPTLAELVNFQ